MARLLLEHGVDHHMGVGSMPLAIALFVSVSALVGLCAKHTRRIPQKHGPETANSHISKCAPTPACKSPLASPKKFVARIGYKTIDPFKKRSNSNADEAESMEMKGGQGFGEGGVWQKSIMMGDKCRPPEFSGVIYYDNHGNQLPEMPRSPRASPLPNLSFPVVKDTNYKC